MQSENPITRLRQAKGWTQTQMAEHFGVNLSTVWRWENEGIPERGATRKAIERELEAAQ